MSKRQKANKEILEILSKIVDSQPELRFIQILTSFVLNSEITYDDFYEESVDTLKHVKETTENM